MHRDSPPPDEQGTVPDEARIMFFINGKIFVNGKFLPGGFHTEDGRFREILAESPEIKTIVGSDVVDLKGATVIPGLVDIHIHGAAGVDFSDCDGQELQRMAEYLASAGVTSFLPTAMTLPKEDYLRAAGNIAAFEDKIADGSANRKMARILGMRMEGPFLSPEKKGAQNEDFLRKPDLVFFREILSQSAGRIRIIDLAPETKDADLFIKDVLSGSENPINSPELRKSNFVSPEQSSGLVISLGHTAATYEEAKRAFTLGASHVTHLFNAMNPIHHRKPGIIPAAAERENVTTEIIADGIHVHESVIKTAFKLFPRRICLISDALSCMGMPDGEYMLSGQKIHKSGGVARLENGTLAGAASSIYEDMLNLVRFGISPEEAVFAATELPARIIGNQKVGAIEAGRYADFLICDEKLNLKEVYVGGEKCRF